MLNVQYILLILPLPATILMGI